MARAPWRRARSSGASLAIDLVAFKRHVGEAAILSEPRKLRFATGLPPRPARGSDPIGAEIGAKRCEFLLPLEVADHVESAVKTVAERGRVAGENVQQVAGNLKSAVDTSVRDQPMATLAVAAALGFVLGALWKS